ncbi:Bro-N domain-containing protein [Serratia marcescens]|nr:Bro-N domain-containing protein [Serratia marcescens]
MVSKNGETRQCANTNRVSMSAISEKTNVNIVAKSEFNFQGKALVPVSNISGVWFTSADLAKALKYSNSRAVTMLYNKYADEFTSGMSQVLEVSTSGNYRKKVRVFSLRGAHLIAMFARSDVAKEFRRWVLDILDRELEHGNFNPAFDFELALHNARAINSHLTAIKEMWRGGLDEALRLMEYKNRGNISERLADMTFFSSPLENSLNEICKNGMIH